MTKRMESRDQMTMSAVNGKTGLFGWRCSRRWLLLSLAGCLMALGAIPGQALADVEWQSETFAGPTHLPPGGEAQLRINVDNRGATASSGPPTATIELPPGITSKSAFFFSGGYVCNGTTIVVCNKFTNVTAYTRGGEIPLVVKVDEAAQSGNATVTVAGGGAAESSVETVPLVVSATPLGFGLIPGTLVAGAFDQAGNDYTQAGGHPYDASVGFRPSLGPVTATDPTFPPNQGGGHYKDIVAELPPGFVGDPTAVPTCPQSTFYDSNEKNLFCPANTQVGVLFLFSPQFAAVQTSAVWNLEPNADAPALFGFFTPAGRQLAIPSVRSDGNYGITVSAKNLTEAGVIYRSKLVIWGNPASPSHDVQRCKNPNPVVLACVGVDGNGIAPQNPTWANPQSSDAPEKAFLSNPTNCADPPSSTLHFDKWDDPAPEEDFSDPRWTSYTINHPTHTGCEQVPFDPTMSMQPTTKQADSPTGLDVHLRIPREKDDEVGGLVQAHLKKATATLPEGFGFNSGVADGLAACTPAQIGLTSAPGQEPIRFNNVEPNCPDASKIGTGEVISPLLEEHLRGEVFLASQNQNPFGSNFAIYVVVREPSVLVKLAGKVEPDPITGQVKVTFDENPQLPFEDFIMHFYDGPRGALATPVTCGTFTSQTALAPWSAADPDNPQPSEIVNDPDPFTIDSSPAGACTTSKAQLPFDIGLSAGSKDPVAGAHSPFSLRVTRPDANQEIDRLEISPPLGFTATLKGIPYCSEAQIASAIARDSGKAEQQSPSCPVASEVGTTNVGAGAGSRPFYAPGKVYLSGPYKGEKLSVVVITPAVAGPFDLGNVVVRSALKLNPRTAQITAVTDPLPRMIEGVPLRVKDIRVDLDRPNWAINPTSCEEKQVKVTAFGTAGAVSHPVNRYQLGSCENLGFKPKLSIRFKGGTKRGDHPALIAKLTTRKGDANIARAAVTLPRSAFLDQAHIRTICTRVQFAAEACPKGATYGFASVITPLLDDPLEGNVILRSSDNKLPDLVGDLKGVADIEAVGRIDSIKGGIRNTFDIVPDAPFDSFTLRMQGGKKGLVVNSQNLCGKAHRATVRLTAHNGRRHNFRPKVVPTGCKKAKRKGQKKRGAGRDGGKRGG